MKNSTVALMLRKGAWTAEEDILLTKCIEKHGEEKWHQVPQKAGLNRCRKSCRLRWLNYLRPNINRGNFTSDEVNLMIRLHNLLGNRWSLIAGRLPGRTANDVKNYWNSHVQKKPAATAPVQKLEAKMEDLNKTKEGASACICTCNVVKPLPWTFSKTTTNCFNTPNNIVDQSAAQNNNNNNNNICNNVLVIKPPSPLTPPLPPPPPLLDDWWENLLVEIGTHDHQGSVSLSSGDGEIEHKEFALGPRMDESSLATIFGVEELGQNGWTDILNLLNAD